MVMTELAMRNALCKIDDLLEAFDDRYLYLVDEGTTGESNEKKREREKAVVMFYHIRDVAAEAADQYGVLKPRREYESVREHDAKNLEETEPQSQTPPPASNTRCERRLINGSPKKKTEKAAESRKCEPVKSREEKPTHAEATHSAAAQSATPQYASQKSHVKPPVIDYPIYGSAKVMVGNGDGVRIFNTELGTIASARDFGDFIGYGCDSMRKKAQRNSWNSWQQLVELKVGRVSIADRRGHFRNSHLLLITREQAVKAMEHCSYSPEEINQVIDDVFGYKFPEGARMQTAKELNLSNSRTMGENAMGENRAIFQNANVQVSWT